MIIREHAVDWPAAWCDAEMELFSKHCAKVDQIQKEYEKGLHVLQLILGANVNLVNYQSCCVTSN
jgi:hypothetical protein